MKFPKLKFPNIDSSDIVITAAFALLFAGLCMYQLRIALVVVGGLLLAYGVASEFVGHILERPKKTKGKG